MKITPILADQSPVAAVPPGAAPDAFVKALEGLQSVLSRADGAEDAFAAHTGSLQDAIFERAQADVALSVATAAAQRTAQALQAVLALQI